LTPSSLDWMMKKSWAMRTNGLRKLKSPPCPSTKRRDKGGAPAAVQTRQRDGNCRKLLSGSSTEDAMPESTSSSSQPESQPEPNEKLVKIFDIESDLKSIDAVQNAFPGVGGTVILVREEDALEAKKIIEAYRKLPPLDDETADLPG